MKMRGGLFSGRVLQEKLDKKANEVSKREKIVSIVAFGRPDKDSTDERSHKKGIAESMAIIE